MMDFSQFNDEDIRQTGNIIAAKSNRHMNTDSLIEPWVNNNIFNNKTQRCKRPNQQKNTQKIMTQRKKTTDERIEEIYKKYNKEGMSKNRQNMRVNSREIYREMLKQFQKAQEFKQIGPRMQQLELQIGAEPFSLELLKKKVSSYSCAYDYKQITMKQPFIAQEKNVSKCSDKFQKIMKIRERLRKKNNLTVSKQKEKYLSQYNPILLFSQRESLVEVATHADREKAKMQIRIKSKSRSQNKISHDSINLKIGIPYSAFGHSLNSTKNYLNRSRTKYSTTRFKQTMHLLKQ